MVSLVLPGLLIWRFNMLYAIITFSGSKYILGMANTPRGVRAVADGNLIHLENANIDVYEYKVTKADCNHLPLWEELI